ncbi:MAG: hypothetical protein K0Q47_29 [Sedimentibacter sp.]|jgi:hypothetical protein|nr:hypothetical protein [Sedimentibacter sp.]
MKKNNIIRFAIGVLVATALITTHYVSAKEKEIHTFENVAIYYSEGYIIDEDGDRFEVKFDCPNDTVISVTYDNQNTVTRLDDIPIRFEILK